MIYARGYWAMQAIPIPPLAQYVSPKKLNPLRANAATDEDDISQILLTVNDFLSKILISSKRKSKIIMQKFSFFPFTVRLCTQWGFYLETR